MKLAHILNPVKVPVGNELHTAQPITFESIRVAKEFAAEAAQIELYTVCYPEDEEIIPDYFKRLPVLAKSVLDVGVFSTERKYPLLQDVLHRLYENSTADYLIFTNMDISLMPQFYTAAVHILSNENCDALLVNRRGISKHYSKVEELPLMYCDYGKPHPGFDCFIFKRELFPKLILENICVGVSFSEVALVHNLIAFAKKLVLADDLHLTFHIGTEVMPPLNQEYYRHNRGEYEQKIYPKLKPLLDVGKFPYSELEFYKRVSKWALNPVFRTHQVLEMEGKNLGRKLKHRIDTLRFKWLQQIK